MKQNAEKDISAFRPDWSITGTRSHIEKEFTDSSGAEESIPPFKWNGVGWYLTKGKTAKGRTYEDSMLIVPYGQASSRDEELYLVCVWNHHSAINAIKWIAEAPVQVDQRDG